VHTATGADQPGPASADAAAPADAPDAPTAPHRPLADLPAAGQVAARVTSLRLDDDGHHELTMDLHPAELGSVGVDVVVDGGRVHVSIRAEQPAAADLLRSSVDELRRMLAEHGLDVGGCDVGSWQQAAGGDGGRPGTEPDGHSRRRGATTAADLIANPLPRPRAASGATGVDVLL
jgi:flagellar hook-length control protein FliK